MEPLKNLVNQEIVELYAHELNKHLNGFDSVQFKHLILDKEWGQRELMDRIHHVAYVIQKVSNGSFNDTVEGLEKAAPNLPTGFEQIIFPAFVKLYGLDHFERSMLALERLTQYSTGEFAIRPFIKVFPEKTMKQMLSWSNHKNEHVRRFSSEGCRPRLPWGGNLPNFIKDPEPIFPILKKLRNDESLYVRKSVANNLNDISKDHPETVLRIAECWLKENKKHSSWIVKHALRSLLKQPHPKALELFGYGNVSQIEVTDLTIVQESISIGDSLKFSFSLSNLGKQKSKLRVEYLIDYKKKLGSSAKVFQISEFELEGNSKRTFTKTQSFKDMTTRKHYPGIHNLSIRVNGVIKVLKTFELN
ncbi:MAG: DNA alkylation repair protein [Salibacteraceae bacterium]